MTKFLLSLDQATATTGYAIFTDGVLSDYGAISPKGNYLERIVVLRKWLSEQLDKYPQEEITVGVEEIQLQENLRGQTKDMSVVTFKKLAHVQGVILELLTSRKIAYELVYASQWKNSCEVRGAARAEQKAGAAAFVESLLNITPSQDECDAICLGWHLLYGEQKKKPISQEDGFNWTN